MWFWWFMLISSLLIPALMITAGWFMWKRPPKKINSAIGYRTSRSMKNMDTWKYAHEYCGGLWQKTGWIILILSLLLHFPFYHSSKDVIGVMSGILCAAQCLFLITTVFLTEQALKRTFTNEGVRK